MFVAVKYMRQILSHGPLSMNLSIHEAVNFDRPCFMNSIIDETTECVLPGTGYILFGIYTTGSMI